MNREQRDNRNRVTPPPVERIELNVERPRLRIFLLVCALAVGLFFIGWGVYQLLHRDYGWTEISVNAGAGETDAWAFHLEYEVSGSAEAKLLEKEYSELAVYAHKCFHSSTVFDGVVNLADVNASPNTVLKVEPPLYDALRALTERGDRYLFLGPVYEVYANLFCSVSDVEAASFDPRRDEETAAYIHELLPFILDPGAVSLSLLGEGQVRLEVSEEYLAFAEENQISSFIDLSWMANAFQIDCIADGLLRAGFRHGVLHSDDGFVRILDDRGERFSYPVYSRESGPLALMGEITVTGPMSLIRFRDWSGSDSLIDYCYTYEDGTCVTGFIDPSDGLSKSALSELWCYSDECSCGGLLAAAAPLYIDESFDEGLAGELSEGKIYFAYGLDSLFHDTGSA